MPRRPGRRPRYAEHHRGATPRGCFFTSLLRSAGASRGVGAAGGSSRLTSARRSQRWRGERQAHKAIFGHMKPKVRTDQPPAIPVQDRASTAARIIATPRTEAHPGALAAPRAPGPPAQPPDRLEVYRELGAEGAQGPSTPATARQEGRAAQRQHREQPHVLLGAGQTKPWKNAPVAGTTSPARPMPVTTRAPASSTSALKAWKIATRKARLTLTQSPRCASRA